MSISRPLLNVVMLTLVTGAFIGGCAGSKSRGVDVGAGEYYSADELDALSRRQKSNYCDALGAELESAQNEQQRMQKEIQDAKDTIQALRKEVVPIEQEVLALESRIRTLDDQIEEVMALPGEWKIKDGDTLTLIAMKENIYNDIEKWTKIFEANQDKIDDPYFIFPDTVLVIPRDWPTD
jgi:chromosome segregation ATPase